MIKDNKLVKGTCFFGHKWTKWEYYERETYNVKYSIQYSQPRQKRECKRCGRLENESV